MFYACSLTHDHVSKPHPGLPSTQIPITVLPGNVTDLDEGHWLCPQLLEELAVSRGEGLTLQPLLAGPWRWLLGR